MQAGADLSGETTPTASQARPPEPADEVAVAVTASAPTSPVEAAGSPPANGNAENGGWPDEAAEAAFLAEARNRGDLPGPAQPAADAPPEAEAPLPSLDELVPRIPPTVREALDELFRAKFVRVVRVPPEALKR